MAGFRDKLHKWRDRKGDGRAQPGAESDPASDAASVASTSKVRKNDQHAQSEHLERSGDSPVNLVHRPKSDSSATAQSLWDRAYDALGKDKAQLVRDYEKLLSQEEQMANPALQSNSSAQDAPHNDVTLAPDSSPRHSQLDTVIRQGLQRVEDKKAKYTIAGHEFVLTDQVAQAAGFVLWAKDWIGEAVKASPEASIAWAGVCMILPLLTNAKTTEDANRDGFTYVTTRMRYYTALEPLLTKLGENAGVTDALIVEASSSIMDLYQHILEFQIKSVLRFYQSRLKGYAKDTFLPTEWKTMREEIERLEAAANGNLRQINELVSRQVLESLDKTSNASHDTMLGLLSVSQQQLRVAEKHVDIAEKQLAFQEDAAQRALTDKEEKIHQVFRLTADGKDATYEWYKNRVEDRVEGTCQWFLTHDHFQQWLREQDFGPLLVSADPGCGKSVLAKYLVDHALPQSAAAAATTTTICYFFFKDQDQNTVRQALCALLHQLFAQNPALIEHAVPEYARDGSQLVHATESLWRIFDRTVRDARAGTVIVVLDALDECAEDEFKDLIRHLKDQFDGGDPAQAPRPKLKLLLTSRPYEQIVSQFDGDQDLLDAFPHVHIPGEEQSDAIGSEVNLVIQYRVKRMKLPAQVRVRLTDNLLAVSHRTYLWIYMVFDHLETESFKKTAKGVDAAIATLPKSVPEAYEQILNKSKNHREARKALAIVLAARRPLTLSEMNVAMNIQDDNVGHNAFDDLDLEDDEDFKHNLRSWCGLFLSVYHGKVYFLHQTAREFLLADQPTSPSPSNLRWHHSITARHAHTVLAELCVLYLYDFTPDVVSFTDPTDASDEWDEPDEPDEPDELDEPDAPDGYDNRRIAFLNYSALHWAFHFHEAGIADDARIVPLASGICDPESGSHVTWSAIYCEVRFGPGTEDLTGLTAAAYFGLESVVRFLLQNGAGVNVGDTYSRTPLMHAIEKDHESVVRLLLEHGADVEAADKDGKTPLSYAAENAALTQLLLEAGAPIETTNAHGRTPLSYAAEEGHEAVARLLLDNGANIETKTEDGFTPLTYAALYGHTAVARLLLDRGADTATATGADAWTPLFFAASEGWEVIVRLLVEQGADIEATNARDQTPLWVAAMQGHEAIVRILLEEGADVNVTSDLQMTPLLWAALRGYEGIVRLLLERGADMEAINNDGQTPLSLAAEQGRVAAVRLLLEHGANIDTRDKFDKTPLFYADDDGYDDVVELLESYGAQY
ncbi:ankyrin repeat-containing protein [Sporothrix schenckii 1099-18]|uniref:Ankyrin repeat-containing protein n=1 Tax=Sporothrix schenckii 1099-18 TaxID=1397361 RepID=A0A0F2M3N0_SPOSC|nr:ankyrin repeat-containing protein [Sporothrix schenckii 1099-18]KJR84272.1 ankyrin repeat-containing protein [Sporothrix schenckii 1099-18]